MAKVRGYCIFHGAALMSCADVTFCAEDAQIMPTFIQYYATGHLYTQIIFI